MKNSTRSTLSAKLIAVALGASVSIAGSTILADEPTELDYPNLVTCPLSDTKDLVYSVDMHGDAALKIVYNQEESFSTFSQPMMTSTPAGTWISAIDFAVADVTRTHSLILPKVLMSAARPEITFTTLYIISTEGGSFNTQPSRMTGLRISNKSVKLKCTAELVRF